MNESLESKNDDDDEEDDPTKNVKSNLKSRDRVFYSTQTDDEILLKNTDDNSLQFSRFLSEKLYKEFRTLLSKTKRFNAETYPKHRRFGVFVDRDNESNKDEITFFEVCSLGSTVFSSYYGADV